MVAYGGLDGELEATLTELAQRGVTSLLVEGGATVLGSFLDAGLVDRVAAFVAPMVVGGAGAPSPVGGIGAALLRNALRFDRVTIQRLGDDVLAEGDVVRVPVGPDCGPMA